MKEDSLPFSHVDDQNRAGMVDIGGKEISARMARARAVVELPTEIIAVFQDGELHCPKGPVFQTARLAGTMACKRTSELIPLCHPLLFESCRFSIELQGDGQVVIECVVKAISQTGVEMEALVGASVAALTVYDMCKAVSHAIVIRETRLLEKTGGKSDFKRP